MFPEDIDNYIKSELRLGAMMGQFKIPPFITNIGISPISSRPKKDSNERCIILDLSWPPGWLVNDGIDKNQYCRTPIQLTYLTIDMLAKCIFDLRKQGEVRMWKKDLKRVFRLIPLCPKDYSLTWVR